MPVLGAGSSKPLGFPDWGELIERLRSHPEVNASHLAFPAGSKTSSAEVLFEHFRQSLRHSPDESSEPFSIRKRQVRLRWLSVVRDCLYQGVAQVSSHPYLRQFVELIAKAPLTVNYNFDDSVEEMLDELRVSGGVAQQAYETVWEPTVQFSLDSGVIYHPNGFLPREHKRAGSAWLTFSEESFEDQLIDAQHGVYSTLLSHFFRNTGLLIGISLNDPTLRNLLRQCARANPGHVHYYVAYSEKPAAELTREVLLQRDARFRTFNVVTLSLCDTEICALARILSMSDEDFAILADDAGVPKNFVFYLSGPVGVGKTTVLSHLKCLRVFSEWLEPKPELVLKAADSLTECERASVDAWIDRQFKNKNLLLSRLEHQLCACDRSLIDPLAFADTGSRSKRVQELLALFAGHGGPVRGAVVLLVGSPEILDLRSKSRHKQGSVEYLRSLQERFSSLWSCDSGEGVEVFVVDTAELSIREVVHEVSKIIHLEDFRPVDLRDVANRFGVTGGNVS
ncbi:SIR2-like domain-containing protein [Aquimonas voraii]|uniref:SIR2-like domain-containing protein n=2 Tax=Aquimonas voraii TaxID=265719 RepID=A0A1G6RQB6_9GAMM|nr:SIR2-like domain-containing protein [Aquimonas voraii]